MDAARRDALLQITLVSGFAPRPTRMALKHLGSPEAVLAAGPERLAHAAGITPNRARRIRAKLDELADGKRLAQELELIERHRVHLIEIDDPQYPRLLKLIDDPPPLLYVRGQLSEEDALSLALVGARRCSAYGREQADRFAAACAQAGLTVVSGGAYGIDAAAHRAALRLGGRTVAVLGSGLAEPYPADNIELFDEIAADEGARGAVISELPMTAPPTAQSFPSRNRIISGLSLGVLVIEAALRSGALITARLAAEEHNREVMAVPGRVDTGHAAGCHKMIREGWARLVTHFGDVTDALEESGTLLKADLQPQQGNTAAAGSGRGAGDDGQEAPLFAAQTLTPSQQRIVALLERPLSLDEIAASSGLIVPQVQADLTMLQVRGLIEQTRGRFHRRGGADGKGR